MSKLLSERHNVDALFACIDSKDTDAFLEFLTEDGMFRFGSAPAIQGRAAMRPVLNDFFASIKSSQHTVSKLVAEGNTLICEGTVMYTRHDGRQVLVPFVDVFEYAGKLIAEYKIYIDIGPLYAD
jgi:ketosteroid isomerase-like protein